MEREAFGEPAGVKGRESVAPADGNFLRFGVIFHGILWPKER